MKGQVTSDMASLKVVPASGEFLRVPLAERPVGQHALWGSSSGAQTQSLSVDINGEN